MKKKKTGQAATADTALHAGEDLRRRAEEIAGGTIAQTPENTANLSIENAALLLHELRVHQIELEMQNEELRRSQQGLEDSHARYFELYNLAPVGYLTISEKGLILGVNLAFATLVDVAVSTLIKQAFSQFIFRDDQDIYYLWQKLLFKMDVAQVCELRLVKKDGTQVWTRLVANLAQDTDGATVVRAVVSDITEPKRIEVELAAANLKIEETSKAKTNFLANMSHELRTPLNTIIGFSEVLQDKLFGPLNEKQETFIVNIVNSGRHLLSLINDILDISKVEASKMELELNRINLAEICQGTVAAFSEKARKQQIVLSYTIDSSMDGVPIVADGRKIKQILYNLIDNGIKFNRPQGSVSITVQKAIDIFKQSAVQIVVEDTGIGIADEDQSKLFLPFSQLTQSYYDKQTEGTGLGLALTKYLIELHGGTILLRSELGKGCRFTVLLPISQEKSL
jgi:PAS domain S-box-containing protein